MTWSHLDPHVAVRAQGRVVEAGRRGVPDPPAEGAGGPEDQTPPQAEQRRGAAQQAVPVDQGPVPHRADPDWQSADERNQVGEDSRHLYMAAVTTQRN